jgi:hypothetical protein
MYLSADDARSDFFLAAAVYVIGPTLLGLVIRAVPELVANRVVGTLLAVLVPFLCVAAMPVFLLRYREESLAALRTGGARGLSTGAAVGAVMAVAVAVGELVGGGAIADLPAALLAGDLGLIPIKPASVPALGPVYVIVLNRIVYWLSLAVLAVFLHRRAEYAFRPISEQQRVLVRQAGMACAITAAVASVLLLLDGRPLASLLPAAGVAAAVLLAERLLPQAGLGERWWVWAPVITLALGPLELFAIFFGGADFLRSAQQAAVVALVALVAGMGLHARRSATVAVGVAALLLLADLLSLAGGTQFLL